MLIPEYKLIRKDVIELLKKENMGFVCMDEPKIKGLIGTTLAVTSKISYIECTEETKRSGTPTRAQKDTTTCIVGRIIKWLPRIHQVKNYSDITIIAFNNHPIGGQYRMPGN